jgi:hypothetical protein
MNEGNPGAQGIVGPKGKPLSKPQFFSLFSVTITFQNLKVFKANPA